MKVGIFVWISAPFPPFKTSYMYTCMRLLIAVSYHILCLHTIRCAVCVCVCAYPFIHILNIVRTNVATEILLHNVSVEMQQTHRHMIKQAIFDFGKGIGCSRAEWISEHVGMVCVAAINVWFTAKVEDVFQQMGAGEVNAMRSFLKQQQNQFDELRTIGCLLHSTYCIFDN